MVRTLRAAIPLLLGVIFVAASVSQEGKKFTVKSAKTPIPEDVAEPIQRILSDTSVQLVDAAGKTICDVWFRKEIPTDATPEQIKTGVTFREVKQSEVLGVIQFHANWTDYRKQKIKAGVYTMRLAYQPTDGKHTADVSDYQEFALIIGAKHDTKTALITDAKKLSDVGGDSLELAHPGVFMLWPNPKPGKEPSIDARPKSHWVVNSSINLVVAGKTTSNKIGIGLTLVGHSPAE